MCGRCPTFAEVFAVTHRSQNDVQLPKHLLSSDSSVSPYCVLDMLTQVFRIYAPVGPTLPREQTLNMESQGS